MPQQDTRETVKQLRASAHRTRVGMRLVILGNTLKTRGSSRTCRKRAAGRGRRELALVGKIAQPTREAKVTVVRRPRAKRLSCTGRHSSRFGTGGGCA